MSCPLSVFPQISSFLTTTTLSLSKIPKSFHPPNNVFSTTTTTSTSSSYSINLLPERVFERRGINPSKVSSNRDSPIWGGNAEIDSFEVSRQLDDLAIDGVVYKKTLRLVESSMFADVAGLAYFLSNSLAIENYFGCFFSLPIVISSIRWDLAAGKKTMVATAMLLLTLSGAVKALTYLTFHVLRFNLTQLFLQSTESTRLRKMIVDLEAPRFDSGVILSQDPAVAYIRSEKNLNDDQRRAIHKMLTVKNYAPILRMPGTGKTSTMVHAVKAFLMRGASILLTSYTNSAIDNLLIKLKAQGIDFVRLGRYEAVHPEIRDHCFSATNTCSVEGIRLRMEQVKVFAVTCIGITNPLLANKRFDLCIMDEAGQTTLPVSLGPLMFASKFVLVGDHYQLPPLVEVEG